MANIQNIDPYSSIGDSLSAITSNFVEISMSLSSIEDKAFTFKKQLANYFDNTYSNFLDAANVINTKKDKWSNAALLVATNSAKWLHPITLMYPCLLTSGNFFITSTEERKIYDWLNIYFPISAANVSAANYADKQKIYVGITYKEYLPEYNFTDESIYNNIQTLEYTATNCDWIWTNYFTGSDSVFGVTPTPTPTNTTTPTPTNSLAISTYPVPTPSNTATIQPTPTATVAGVFGMTVLQYSNNIGQGGSVKALFNYYWGGYFIIKIGQYVYYADNNNAIDIDNIPVGTYSVEIANYNKITNISSLIQATLYIAEDLASTYLLYQNNIVPLNTTIYSS